MNIFISNKIIYISNAIALMLFAVTAYATGSTHPQVLPNVGARQSYQANVDMSDCTDYLPSSPYIIWAGNGGTNMKLQCPEERPVMIYWQQQLGFAGPLVVSSGGGQAWIKCCALAHSWQPTK